MPWGASPWFDSWPAGQIVTCLIPTPPVYLHCDYQLKAKKWSYNHFSWNHLSLTRNLWVPLFLKLLRILSDKSATVITLYCVCAVQEWKALVATVRVAGLYSEWLVGVQCIMAWSCIGLKLLKKILYLYVSFWCSQISLTCSLIGKKKKKKSPTSLVSLKHFHTYCILLNLICHQVWSFGTFFLKNTYFGDAWFH